MIIRKYNSIQQSKSCRTSESKLSFYKTTIEQNISNFTLC